MVRPLKPPCQAQLAPLIRNFLSSTPIISYHHTPRVSFSSDLPGLGVGVPFMHHHMASRNSIAQDGATAALLALLCQRQDPHELLGTILLIPPVPLTAQAPHPQSCEEGNQHNSDFSLLFQDHQPISFSHSLEAPYILLSQMLVQLLPKERQAPTCWAGHLRKDSVCCCCPVTSEPVCGHHVPYTQAWLAP